MTDTSPQALNPRTFEMSGEEAQRISHLVLRAIAAVAEDENLAVAGMLIPTELALGYMLGTVAVCDFNRPAGDLLRVVHAGYKQVSASRTH